MVNYRFCPTEMAARPDRVRNPTTKLSAKLNLEYDKILPPVSEEEEDKVSNWRR